MSNPSNKPTNTNKPINVKKISGGGSESDNLVKGTETGKPIQMKGDVKSVQGLGSVSGGGADVGPADIGDKDTSFETPIGGDSIYKGTVGKATGPGKGK